MNIIIDTNFLITSVKNKIQLFEELKNNFPADKILVPIEVVRELEKLEQDHNLSLKEREYAKLSLDLILRKNPSRVPLGIGDVDAGILRHIKQHKKIIVATLDRNLKDRIKLINKEAKFLTIKEKKRVVLQ